MRQVRPPLVELRQYVLAPGGRARMTELFDTVFAAAQDALGLPILGHFHDANDPDRLVWLRGFDDMTSRPDRLGAFYGGPVWAEHGAEAIALVKGYDNVQLLREAAPASGLEADLDARDTGTQPAPYTATTYILGTPPGQDFTARALAALETLPHGARSGAYVSETGANNFPALPIREGQHLFTWIARGHTHIDETSLAPHFAAPPERLTLLPAARSALR